MGTSSRIGSFGWHTAMLLVGLAVALSMGGCKRRPPAAQSRTDGGAGNARPSKDAAQPLVTSTPQAKFLHPPAPGSFARLVRRAGSSVVHLRAASAVAQGPARWLGAPLPATGTDDPSPSADRIRQAAGSGVLLDDAGHIATSANIATSHRDLSAIWEGGSAPLTLVGLDRTLGVALLRIDGPHAGLRPARLGDAHRLEVGEWLLGVANPFGWGPHASVGIVSALPPWSKAIASHGRWGLLQTTIPLHEGNAGCPIFNLAGELVGLATIAEGAVRGTGLVLPADLMHRSATLLRKHGKIERAFIGLYAKQPSPRQRARLRLSAGAGVLIAGIHPGGPAARAGLRKGDVILTLDGVPVAQPRDLSWAADMAGVGRTVRVTAIRDHQRTTFELQTQRRPH